MKNDDKVVASNFKSHLNQPEMRWSQWAEFMSQQLHSLEWAQSRKILTLNICFHKSYYNMKDLWILKVSDCWSETCMHTDENCFGVNRYYNFIFLLAKMLRLVSHWCWFNSQLSIKPRLPKQVGVRILWVVRTPAPISHDNIWWFWTLNLAKSFIFCFYNIQHHWRYLRCLVWLSACLNTSVDLT